MKRRISFIAGWVVVAACIAWLAGRKDALAVLASLSPAMVAGLVAVSLCAIVANGATLQTLAAVAGTRLEALEWIGLTAANTMYNLVLPGRPGILARGYYLSKRHGFPVPRFLALSAAASWYALLVASGVLVLSALSMPEARKGLAAFGIAVMAGVALFGAVALRLSSKARTRPVGRAAAFVFETVKGLQGFRGHRPELLRLVSQNAAFLALSALRLGLACAAVGHRPHWAAVLAASALVGLSAVVSITPGNLGVKEAITASCAGLLGMSPEAALLASLVDRAAATLTVVVVGSFANRMLLRRIDEGSSG